MEPARRTRTKQGRSLHRAATAVALGSITALALAGCGAGTSGDESAAPAESTAPATTAIAGDAEPSGSASPATTPPDAAVEPDSGASDDGAPQVDASDAAGTQVSGPCATGSLSAEVTPAEGGGAAGSVYWDVVLTNTGSAECTVTGFPGVSFTDASGAQVGEPAEREAAEGVTVALAPGASAVAPLRVTSPGIIGGCTPTTASSVVIYPPDQTESLTAAAEIEVCAEQPSTTIGVLAQRS